MEVCDHFLEFKDFNGLMATVRLSAIVNAPLSSVALNHEQINGGLGSTPIHRLKKTLGGFTYKDDEKIPREETEDFDHGLAEKHFSARTVMSSDKNFTNYRQRCGVTHCSRVIACAQPAVCRLEKCELPCFPYVGTFLTDATFAWDGKVCWSS